MPREEWREQTKYMYDGKKQKTKKSSSRPLFRPQLQADHKTSRTSLCRKRRARAYSGGR